MKNNDVNERILAAGVKRSNDGKKTGLNRNDLIIGGSGSGKTTGYVAPNLYNPSGSFVVSDTKGKLYQKYKKHLEELGYLVILIDLVEPDKSCGYNPISYIRRYPDGSIYEPDIKKLALLISPPLDYDEPFWDKANTRYLAMLIGYVAEALPEDQRNMNSVLALHRAYISGKADSLLEEWADENPGSYSARKYAMLSGLRSIDKTFRCIMEFANDALDPFDCDEFSRIFSSQKSIDIHQLGMRKTALFINSSDHDKSYSVLTSIISFQIMQTLIDDADKTEDDELLCPVNLYLDDFAAAARIPDFESTISIIRSRNISVSIILQSLSQLKHMYGANSASTIINNCDTILYLGGGHDLETAQFIANHANKPAYTVLSLPRSKAILITSGDKPVEVDKIKPTDEISGFTVLQ